jgi:hypothetical protein
VAIPSGLWPGKRSLEYQLIPDSYSEEFRYRPASSPIITEYLKDGRVRLRGATIGGQGVRPEDVPKTPAQLKLEENKRREDAREAAKERLGLSKSKRKRSVKGGKGKSAPTRTSGEV